MFSLYARKESNIATYSLSPHSPKYAKIWMEKTTAKFTIPPSLICVSIFPIIFCPATEIFFSKMGNKFALFLSRSLWSFLNEPQKYTNFGKSAQPKAFTNAIYVPKICLATLGSIFPQAMVKNPSVSSPLLFCTVLLLISRIFFRLSVLFCKIFIVLFCVGVLRFCVYALFSEKPSIKSNQNASSTYNALRRRIVGVSFCLTHMPHALPW